MAQEGRAGRWDEGKELEKKVKHYAHLLEELEAVKRYLMLERAHRRPDTIETFWLADRLVYSDPAGLRVVGWIQQHAKDPLKIPEEDGSDASFLHAGRTLRAPNIAIQSIRSTSPQHGQNCRPSTPLSGAK